MRVPHLPAILRRRTTFSGVTVQPRHDHWSVVPAPYMNGLIGRYEFSSGIG